MGESVQHPDKSIVVATNREIKLNRKKVRWYNSVWRNFTEFCERSSIHGIQYLIERRLHWSERLWWLLSLMMSVFMSIYFIHQVWLKFNPVVITFNDQATRISEIPFPTITICSDNVFLPSVLNFSHYSDSLADGLNVSDKIVQQMYSVSALCRISSSEMHEYIGRNNVQIDRNILPYLREVSPDLVRNCRYSDVEYGYFEECKNGFSEVLTDHGLCYTFNHLSSKEIYRAELLADDFPKVEPFHARIVRNDNDNEIFVDHIYPLREQRSGHGINLMISLPTSERIYDENCSRKKFRNAVILFIHSADNVQQLSNRHYVIRLKHRANLKVRPNIISTDDGVLKQYNKYERKCIAEHDNELKFFRKYTQSNCQLEQLVNETLNACNCAHFWMPRESDTQICYGDQLRCSYQIQYEVIRNSDLTNKCLPACNSISYNADIYFTKLDHQWWSTTYEDRIFTEISISFENEQYFGLKRSEKYGKIDFVAGLVFIMGCSFLSFIELIYFATLRVCCNLRKKRVAKNQLDRLDIETGSLDKQTDPVVSENTVEASENAVEASENAVEALENAVEASENAVEESENAVEATENGIGAIESVPNN